MTLWGKQNKRGGCAYIPTVCYCKSKAHVGLVSEIIACWFMIILHRMIQMFWRPKEDYNFKNII